MPSRPAHLAIQLAGALGLVLLLAGCASTPDVTASSEPVRVAAPAPEPEPVERPIPPDSLYPLLEAEFALRNRDFDRGLERLLEQTLILDDPALARRTLQLAEYMERDEEALQAAIRLAELDPDDAAAAATAMALLIRSGESERAIAYARNAKAGGVRINAPALLQDFGALPPEEAAAVAEGIEALAADYPDDADITIALALLYREQERPEAASAALEPLLTRDPGDERGLVLWTQVGLDRGESDAFARIASAVSNDPDNERLRLQYARLLAASERYDDARAQFNLLLDQSPRNGDYLLSLALIETEAGRPDAAREHLNDMVALGQRVDEAWYYLGRLEADKGNIDAAVAAYGRVGEGREYFDAKRRAGQALLQAGRVVEFAGFFDTERRRRSDQADRLYLLQAEVLGSEGADRQAIAVYTEALAQFPDSMSLRYGRAIVYERGGDIASMEADMRRILAEDPDNATTLNALGYSLTNNTDRYDEAAALIERALELAPGDAATQDSLGWVYFKLGRLEEARVLLEAAYDQLPDPEVAAHLGETLWALGLIEDAKRIWYRVLRDEPDNTHVRSTVDRLGVEFP